MKSIAFSHVPPIVELGSEVEYFRISEYAGSEGVAIKVCPNGLPGLVFQHHNGVSAIKCIVTDSGRIVHLPTLFLLGQITELAVMNFKSGPFLSVQAVLKPHALKTLFGMDASTLTNSNRWFPDFAGGELNEQLIDAKSGQECVKLMSAFLLAKLPLAQSRDVLVEDSLSFIQENIHTITVKELLGQLNISERQLEKRFMQSVGVTPQFYIRVKRFNEAIRLMDTGNFERLSDVKVNQFHHDQIGASYLA